MNDDFPVMAHHSMSYLMVQKKWMRFFLPLFRCQSVSVAQQYGMGVRFFDIHIRFDKEGNPFFCNRFLRFGHIPPSDVFLFLNKMGGCHVRLVLETWHNSCFQEQHFYHYFAYLETTFPKIVFYSGYAPRILRKKSSLDVGENFPLPLISTMSLPWRGWLFHSPLRWMGGLTRLLAFLISLFPACYAHRFNRDNIALCRKTSFLLLMDFVEIR